MLKYEHKRTALAVLLMRRLYFYNRSCMAVQGGYFFMFFMTSHNATNKIINITVSVISTTPLKGVRTTAAVLLLFYYSTFYYRVQYTKLPIYRGQVCIFCLLIYWVQYSTIYSQQRNRATAKADGVG